MPVVVHSTRPEPACNPQPATQVAYYRRLPESALLDRRLTRTALALLAVLDGYARDKPHCWPAVATLMAHLGCCRRTVQLALGALKACGYVSERPATNPTGRILVLAWKETFASARGAQPAATGGAQVPYSQGIPRERRRLAPEGRPRERNLFGSAMKPQERTQASVATPCPAPRVPDRPPTPQERAEVRRQWLEAAPVGTALGNVLSRLFAQG